MNTKPAAQLSLESILEHNRAAAKRLASEAAAMLDQNAVIEAEMQKVLSSAPPVSRLVQAYKNGDALKRLGLENDATVSPDAPISTRMSAEREVIYAALAIVRSWQRRHKKTFHAQERELMKAVLGLTWEK